MTRGSQALFKNAENISTGGSFERGLEGCGQSRALHMAESLLGRGWNASRRRCWCDDGRISVDRARLTQSPPSTVPILTSEFVIADRRAFKRFDGEDTARLPEEEVRFLWRLHRKEPGCVVGEHMQVRRCAGGADFLMKRSTAMERPEEVDGSTTENLTVGDEPWRLTPVGDGEREKKAEDWGEKVEEEEAKEEEENLPEGEMERWRFDDESGRTGPLDLPVLEEAVAAIMVGTWEEAEKKFLFLFYRQRHFGIGFSKQTVAPALYL